VKPSFIAQENVIELLPVSDPEREDAFWQGGLGPSPNWSDASFRFKQWLPLTLRQIEAGQHYNQSFSLQRGRWLAEQQPAD
jgi:hypothetical protein